MLFCFPYGTAKKTSLFSEMGSLFAFGNVFTRFTLIMNFLHLLPVRKPHRWKRSGLPLPDAGG